MQITAQFKQSIALSPNQFRLAHPKQKLPYHKPTNLDENLPNNTIIYPVSITPITSPDLLKTANSYQYYLHSDKTAELLSRIMVLEGILITKAALTRKIINTLTSELIVFEERMSRMESSMQNMTSNVIHQILLNAKPFPLSQS